MAENVETPVAAPAADIRTSTTVPEYSDNGAAQEAHFQAALNAALKEAPLPDPDADAKATPLQLQEAADLEAHKAKEAEATKDPAAKEPEAAKDSPGTLGKIRRLFNEGKLDEAWQLAFGVSPDKVEPTTKQWKAAKAYFAEAKEEANQAREQAQAEVAQARHVATQLQPFIQGAQEYLKGDYAAFLRLTTGDTPEQFQRKLVNSLHAAPTADPAMTARLEQIERERQQERAQNMQARQQYEQAQKQMQYEQAVGQWKANIVEELKADPRFAKVATKPLVLDKIYALQEANLNPRTRTTIDTLDAAEMVWEELYGGVVETPQAAGAKAGTTQAPRVNGANTEHTGASNAQTTLRHQQAIEAGPVLTQEWSPENQEKILEHFARKARSEAFAATQ